MAYSVIRFVLLVTFVSKIPAENSVSIDRLLLAVEKLVNYYQTNYHLMNLDGIFGLRVLEGQIQLILDKISREQIGALHPPSHIKDWNRTILRMSQLQRNARNISAASLASLQKLNPQYFKLLHHLVEKPMRYAKDYKLLDHSLKWDHQQTDIEMTEDFSDKCVGEILGSTNEAGVKCSISTMCLEFILESKMKDYSLTHQLLYTIIAEQNGCSIKLTRHLLQHGLARTVDGLQAEFCTNNFYQLAELVHDVQGNIIPRMQDLFMEEEFVCPLLGYMEFLHNDWLEQIISWQSSEGCYGSMPRSFLGRYSQDRARDYDYNNKKEGVGPEKDVVAVQQGHDKLVIYDGMKGGHTLANSSHPKQIWSASYTVKPQAQKIGSDGLSGSKTGNKGYGDDTPIASNRNHRVLTLPNVKSYVKDGRIWKGPQRRLLDEKRLRGGCMAHKTAVALAALSQYLRFMIHPGPSHFQTVVSLTGINHLMSVPHRTVVTAKPVISNSNQPLQHAVVKKTQLQQPAVGQQEVDATDNDGQPVIRGRVAVGNMGQEKAEQLVAAHNQVQDQVRHDVDINQQGSVWKDSSQIHTGEIQPNQGHIALVQQGQGEAGQNRMDQVEAGQVHFGEVVPGEREESIGDHGDDNPHDYYNAGEIEVENNNGAVVMKEMEHDSWEDMMQAAKAIDSKLLQPSSTPQLHELEYEQYIDNDSLEDERSEIDNPSNRFDGEVVNKAKELDSYQLIVKVDSINQMNHPGLNEGGKDEEEEYSYYDNKDDDDDDDKSDEYEEDISQESAVPVIEKLSGIAFGLSEGTIYVIVLTVILLVLFFMWKFIRSRRVLIRYRYK